MGEPRIIKKYSNRRPYDATQSCYIDFEELQRIVNSGIDLVVIEKETGRDITQLVLLQVIAASEQGGSGVLSRDFLLQMIRSQEAESPSLAASYLEQSLKLFRDQGQTIDSGSQKEGEPAEQLAERLAQKHYQLWRTAQDRICRALTNYSGSCWALE